MASIGHNRGGHGRMYAISFDLDTGILREVYGSPSWRNASMEIRRTLAEAGFDGQQGSVYFGNAGVDAVTRVLAVQKLAREYPWFRPGVRDIRMLRIEENNDLGPDVDGLSP